MTDWLAKRIGELVRVEGGFVDHPADRGGPTKYGITMRTLSAHRGGPVIRDDVERLSEAEARDIYLQRYWLGPRFDAIAAVSKPIAAELLDTGVNMGPRVAAQFLQRALNALAGEPPAYPDLDLDGAIGPITLAALRRQVLRRGTEGENVLVKMLNAQQGGRYLDIVKSNPSQRAFVYGWFRTRI